jgi:transcriptional regulator of NAD metabolism
MQAIKQFYEDDTTYGLELIAAFLRNFNELRSSLLKAVMLSDAEVFHKAIHKDKVAIELSNHSEFQQCVRDIRSILTEKGISAIDSTHIESFDRHCSVIIRDLEDMQSEINNQASNLE